MPASIGVAAHAHPVIDHLSIGQEDLRIAPAALALAVAVEVTGIDHPVYARIRVVPVVWRVVVEGVVHRIAVMPAITIAEGGPKACAKQAAGQDGSAIAFTCGGTKQSPNQSTGKNSLTIGLAEAIRIVESAARIVIVEALVIAPVRPGPPVPVAIIAVAIGVMARLAIATIAIVAVAVMTVPAIVVPVRASVATVIKALIPALVAAVFLATVTAIVEALVTALISSIFAATLAARIDTPVVTIDDQALIPAVIKALVTALVATDLLTALAALVCTRFLRRST